MTGVTIKDRRRLPFVMVTKAAIEAIRESFDNRRGQTALAVYVGIVECANDARSDSFEIGRGELAERCQVHVKSLDVYVSELEQLYLVRVDRERGLQNRWTLTDPPAADQGVQDSLVVGSAALPGAERPGLPGPGSPGLPTHVTKQEGKKEDTSPSSKGDVVRVFEAWVEATGRTAQTRLDSKRRGVIARALKAHGLDECLLAVRNIGRDRWARGANNRGTRFDEIVHALGNAERLEKWRDWRPQTSAHEPGSVIPAQPLDAHVATIANRPVTLELNATWAPIAAEMRDIVDPAAALELAPLHLHGETDDGLLVIGCPPGRATWLKGRFSTFIADVAENPVTIVECRCPQEQAA